MCGQRLIESARLLDVAGKAVQHTAAGAIGLRDAVEQHADSDLVRDEAPTFDKRLRLLPEVCALADVLAKELACGDVREAGLVFEDSRLGAFAGAREAEEDYVQACRPPVSLETLCCSF